MGNILLLLLFCAFLSGCAASGEVLQAVAGTSTVGVEDAKKNALAKVFDYDFDTCYAKMEGILAAMPKVSIYAKDRRMIALYYIDPNTTPVGVFFKEVDPSHTRVEVSSEGVDAKAWIAKNLFSETVLPATSIVKALDSDKEYGKF